MKPIRRTLLAAAAQHWRWRRRGLAQVPAGYPADYAEMIAAPRRKASW